jgi:hypothetical protein
MNSVKIIVTTYISDDLSGIREFEYRAVLSFLKNNLKDYEVVIVETKNLPGSFLEEYGFQVVYADIPNSYRNKGCNEALMLLKLEKEIKEDIVIKLTGRYLFRNNTFINIVHNSKDEDVICRLSGGKLWTGCYSAKREIFFKSIRYLDIEKMEKDFICIEDELWDTLKSYRVKLLDEIGILSRIANNSYISFM